MKTVLMTAPYMIPFMDRFRPILHRLGLGVIEPEVEERFEAAELLRFAGHFDGTICGDDRYTREVVAACSPRLKVIAKWGTGIDSIDQDACADYGVKLLNTTNAFTVPVAESVMGYMLAFARRQPWMDREMKAGVWNKLPGHTLSESTLGVIGVGNIGKAVLRRARAFGMKLLGNDIVEIAPDFLVENGVEVTSLEDLLRRADYISVNCSLNLSSRHLMNAVTLAHVKPNAVLINTSRGAVVDEPALVEALSQGQLHGAALDVFEDEPLPAESPLRRMDNVMLAPHNTNSSPVYWERIHWNTLRNLLIGLDIPVGDINSLRALEAK
ncbi:MAG: phosphoglycerate dehydrogenase [Anaerolineaceae bacterium]